MKTKNQWAVDFSIGEGKIWHVFNRKTALTKKSFRTRAEARAYATKLNN